MNVTLRRSLMVCVLALILAAMAAGVASAAPRTVDPDTLTPPPPPGAECKQTGNYIICHTFGDESWANQPDLGGFVYAAQSTLLHIRPHFSRNRSLT
jgi:hypothetical protein